MRMPLFAMSIGAFGIGTAEFVIMGILPQMAASSGVSLAEAGLAVSAYAIGVVLGAPLLTVATTRIPRKPLMIGLMGAFAVANLATALAPDFGFLLATRFVAGLPHGAFFGAAAVVGASLVSFDRRARAISGIMSGLTVATIVGVPVSALLVGQFSWRWIFAAVAALGIVAAAAIWITVPDTRGVIVQTRAADEIRAIRSKKVLLPLVTGAVGFGGMFAAYTYLTPILEEVTGLNAVAIAITLAVFGVGLTLGNVVGGQVADRAPIQGLFAAFTTIALVLLMMFFSMGNPVLAIGGVFLMATSSSLVGPIMQRLLLDGAHAAPSLASSMHHAAFNLANANGAWLGGLALSAGLSLTAPLLVGVGLALAGLALSVPLARAHAEAAVPDIAPAELVTAS
ncbi:MFS transporter [Glycomyces harbinensis]|uniref:MFS transporter, DHA1 family, inner membrane transport protein n=1 Tax=Glycomyces harbinensis TaxID=58114 RepID=A0A1G6T2K3_9ACTN|nr:MFS transporter [Glycomyces harbinensis]SDD23410.1 MFS transporter, DHA1 family, inner membrane transport protein [Glycomyces harbinensis]